MNLKITGQNYEKELSFTGFAMSKLQNLFLVITTRKKGTDNTAPFCRKHPFILFPPYHI
ncbi:hypothetical protein IMSAGC014_01631 [Bacteroidaceae bacterium]|nr:hypothetical protein IMSAGC014_01631 [Bacteroidaceae bacterium]